MMGKDKNIQGNWQWISCPFKSRKFCAWTVWFLCCAAQGTKHRTQFCGSELFELMLNPKPKHIRLDNFVYQHPLLFNCLPSSSQIPHGCQQSFSYFLQYSRPQLKILLHLLSPNSFSLSDSFWTLLSHF